MCLKICPTCSLLNLTQMRRVYGWLKKQSIQENVPDCNICGRRPSVSTQTARRRRDREQLVGSDWSSEFGDQIGPLRFRWEELTPLSVARLQRTSKAFYPP